jgi:cell division protein FtsW (lipid II flippase)
MSASLLRGLLSCVLAADTLDRVVDPLLADAAAEHQAALSAGRHWAARWTRLRGAWDLARTLGALVVASGADGARAMRLRLPLGAAAVALVGVVLLREIGAGRHGAQATWLAVAMAVSFAWLAMPARWLAARRRWFVLAALLLAWPAIAGEPFDGAQRWVTFGPLRLTPGELARPALLLAIAGALRATGAGRRAVLAEAMVMTTVGAAALAWQPDLGSAAVLLCAATAMCIDFGGVRAAAAISVPAAVAAGAALARGALGDVWAAGAGEAAGATDTDLLLVGATDRFGVAGALLPLALLILLATELWSTAAAGMAGLPRTLARGVATALVAQAALHAVVAIGVLPRAAVTLPLLGYGGTSLVSWMLCMMAVGSAAAARLGAARTPTHARGAR